jgi:hypothetical protein
MTKETDSKNRPQEGYIRDLQQLQLPEEETLARLQRQTEGLKLLAAKMQKHFEQLQRSTQ